MTLGYNLLRYIHVLQVRVDTKLDTLGSQIYFGSVLYAYIHMYNTPKESQSWVEEGVLSYMNSMVRYLSQIYYLFIYFFTVENEK